MHKTSMLLVTLLVGCGTPSGTDAGTGGGGGSTTGGGSATGGGGSATGGGGGGNAMIPDSGVTLTTDIGLVARQSGWGVNGPGTARLIVHDGVGGDRCVSTTFTNAMLVDLVHDDGGSIDPGTYPVGSAPNGYGATIRFATNQGGSLGDGVSGNVTITSSATNLIGTIQAQLVRADGGSASLTASFNSDVCN